MRRLALLPVSLVFSLTSGLNAQANCSNSTESGHSAWQQDWVEAHSLGQQITEVIRSSGGDPAGGVVFSVLDIASKSWSTRVFGLSLSPEVAARVRQLVEEYMAGLPVARTDLTIELEAPEIPLWEDRTEDCPPALLSGAKLEKELNRVGRSLTRIRWIGPRLDLEPGSELRAVCRILIDSKGAVRHAELREDETVARFEGLESDLADIMLEMRFEPATRNGAPIPFWAEFPVCLKLQ